MTRHHMLLLASRVFTIDADELFYAHPRTPDMEDAAYDLCDEARGMCEDVERETHFTMDVLWEEAMAWFHRGTK